MEKKITLRAPSGAGAQTQDLPRARRELPAARHAGCLDKQAFLCLQISLGACTTPRVACFGDSLLLYFVRRGSVRLKDDTKLP